MIRGNKILLSVLLVALASVSAVKANQLLPLPPKNSGQINYIAINGSVVADEAEVVDMDAPPKRLDIPIVVNVEKQEVEAINKSGLKTVAVSNVSPSDGISTKTVVRKLEMPMAFISNTSTATPTNSTGNTTVVTQNPKKNSALSNNSASMMLVVLMSLVAGMLLEYANKKIII